MNRFPWAGKHLHQVRGVNIRKYYGREALAESRYHSAWRPQSLPVKLDWGLPLYSEEANELMELSQTGALATGDLTNMKFYSGDRIDSDTLGPLNTVGDPAKRRSNIPVHTPLLGEQLPHGSAQAEQETFQWFVKNDKSGRQALPPIHRFGATTACVAD